MLHQKILALSRCVSRLYVVILMAILEIFEYSLGYGTEISDFTVSQLSVAVTAYQGQSSQEGRLHQLMVPEILWTWPCLLPLGLR